MTPSARLQAAILLVVEIEAAARMPADAVANRFFRDRRFIGAGDRRAVSELVWRVLRNWRKLTWWLGHVGLEDAPRLRVAALLLLDGSAFEQVMASYSGERFAPGALPEGEAARLRRMQGASLLNPRMDEATRLEAPWWVVPMLRARFGEGLEAELAAMEGEAPLDLRVNLLKGTREQALTALRAEGLEVEPTVLSPWGMRSVGRRPVTSGAAFVSGLVEIQDEGSQLVVGLVGAAPEMRVADYCAGAAGKTLAMAMMMGNRGHIAACDVSAPRLEAAAKRLRRAGVHNVERHLLAAGDKWAKRRPRSFDRVLVDAAVHGDGNVAAQPGRADPSRGAGSGGIGRQAGGDTAACGGAGKGWRPPDLCDMLAAAGGE